MCISSFRVFILAKFFKAKICLVFRLTGHLQTLAKANITYVVYVWIILLHYYYIVKLVDTIILFVF